jgi:hypothetical protein
MSIAVLALKLLISPPLWKPIRLRHKCLRQPGKRQPQRAVSAICSQSLRRRLPGGPERRIVASSGHALPVGGQALSADSQTPAASPMPARLDHRHPEGMVENSPAFQRRDSGESEPSPAGTAEIDRVSRPSGIYSPGLRLQSQLPPRAGTPGPPAGQSADGRNPRIRSPYHPLNSDLDFSP